MDKNSGFATKQIHVGKIEIPGIAPLATPIFQTSTFEFDSTAEGAARFAGEEEGYSSAPSKKELIGLEGEAVTSLRPTGTGEFQDKKLDVVTDGEFISKGAPIKIKEVEGFRIVVEKLEDL